MWRDYQVQLICFDLIPLSMIRMLSSRKFHHGNFAPRVWRPNNLVAIEGILLL